ncbi:MAG: hypothetical protein AAFX99_32625 [Myxococcota bacterium]
MMALSSLPTRTLLAALCLVCSAPALAQTHTPKLTIAQPKRPGMAPMRVVRSERYGKVTHSDMRFGKKVAFTLGAGASLDGVVWGFTAHYFVTPDLLVGPELSGFDEPERRGMAVALQGRWFILDTLHVGAGLRWRRANFSWQTVDDPETEYRLDELFGTSDGGPSAYASRWSADDLSLTLGVGHAWLIPT